MNGVAATPPGVSTTPGRQLCSVPSTALIAASGRQHRDRRRSTGRTRTPSHSYGGTACRNGNEPVPVQRPAEPVHRTFVGTHGHSRRGRARAHVADAACLAGAARPAVRQPRRGGNTVTLFPTIGIRDGAQGGRPTRRSASTTRRRTSRSAATRTCSRDRSSRLPLRLRALVRREPLQGADETRPWWNTSTKTCPDAGAVVLLRRSGPGFGANSCNNPWRCVLTAPGTPTGQIGDDIAVATDNCDNINNNLVPDRSTATRRQLRRQARRARGLAARSGGDSEGDPSRASTCSSSRTRRARA